MAAGDLLYVPTNTVAQLVNEDPERPMRVLSARSRLFDRLSYRAVTYLKSAPEWTVEGAQQTTQSEPIAGEGSNA